MDSKVKTMETDLAVLGDLAMELLALVALDLEAREDWVGSARAG